MVLNVHYTKGFRLIKSEFSEIRLHLRNIRFLLSSTYKNFNEKYKENRNCIQIYSYYKCFWKGKVYVNITLENGVSEMVATNEWYTTKYLNNGSDNLAKYTNAVVLRLVASKPLYVNCNLFFLIFSLIQL